MKLNDHNFKYLSEMSKEFSGICNEILTKHLSDKEVSYTVHLYCDYYRRLEDVFYAFFTFFERYNTAYEFPIGILLRTLCADSLNLTYFNLLIANQTPNNEIEKQVGHFNSEQVRYFINDQKKHLIPKLEFYYTDKQFENATDNYYDSLSRLYQYVINNFSSLISHVEVQHKLKTLTLKDTELVQLNEIMKNKNSLTSLKIVFTDNPENKTWMSTTYVLDAITKMPIGEEFKSTNAVHTMVNDAYHLCTYFLQYSKYEHTGLLSNEIEGIPQSVKMNMVIYTIEKILKTFNTTLILLDHLLQNEKTGADFNGYSYNLYKDRFEKLRHDYTLYVDKVYSSDETIKLAIGS